jgi:hypothetical protein
VLIRDVIADSRGGREGHYPPEALIMMAVKGPRKRSTRRAHPEGIRARRSGGDT